MQGPLEGVRVIDLTSMISGPLSTMMLADQGADVIKVEAPSGDHSRRVATRRNGYSASFLNNNRNKRSIVIDLKKPQGLEVLQTLIQEADVFVQNFRPGVAKRLGIGENALRAIKPDLIYVSICGFGLDGPYAQKPVFDPLIQAVSGLTTVQAGSDQQRPRLVRTIVPDKLTAIQTSQAVTAALYAKLKHGNGQHITISMLDTVVYFLWSSDMGGHTFIGDELTQETAQSYIDLVYETADGYISVAVVADKDWAGLAKALERPDFLTDERFSNAALREENKDARTRLTQEALLTYNSIDVLQRLENLDVPCAPVLTRQQMIQHEQIQANETLILADHPVAGPLRQARQPARFSVSGHKNITPAPALGQHTCEVLQQAGFTDDTISSLLNNSAVVQAQTPVTTD
ncbi:carnitine dehydratase [Chromatiales bacterium (ex Bugula neritina AB1)]|nr:carnitine dehydratase [Chromatiales bacterium (ex Bugula neritina AB1)]